MAIAFTNAEPETVNLYLDLEAKELFEEGYRFGELYPHRHALATKPSWATARQSAAGAEGRDHLREENERLQRLLHDAIRAPKDAGEDRKAARYRASPEWPPQRLVATAVNRAKPSSPVWQLVILHEVASSGIVFTQVPDTELPRAGRRRQQPREEGRRDDAPTGRKREATGEEAGGSDLHADHHARQGDWAGQ